MKCFHRDIFFSFWFFFVRCRSFPEAVLIIFMGVLFGWLGFFSLEQLWCPEVAGPEPDPTWGRAVPAQPGELWQGKPHVKRNSTTVSKTSCDMFFFSLKDQVALTKWFFLRKYLDLGKSPKFFEPHEVSCSPLRFSPDYTWVWESLSKYSVGALREGTMHSPILITFQCYLFGMWKRK